MFNFNLMLAKIKSGKLYNEISALILKNILLHKKFNVFMYYFWYLCWTKAVNKVGTCSTLQVLPKISCEWQSATINFVYSNTMGCVILRLWDGNLNHIPKCKVLSQTFLERYLYQLEALVIHLELPGVDWSVAFCLLICTNGSVSQCWEQAAFYGS
jgi:hypothetical protein